VRGFLNRPLFKFLYGRMIFPMVVNNLFERISEQRDDASDPKVDTI